MRICIQRAASEDMLIVGDSLGIWIQNRCIRGCPIVGISVVICIHMRGIRVCPKRRCFSADLYSKCRIRGRVNSSCFNVELDTEARYPKTW